MNENTPAVTVIIPTYNSSGTLRLSLESVLGQAFSDYEVWVVGDACTDDSESVVARMGDARMHWVNLPVNSGTPSQPRNEGMRRARGRWVAYLGHDDLWFPWHLSELVNCIEQTGDDLVFSLGILVGPEGGTRVFGLPRHAWDVTRAVSPSTWLHTRALVDTIGPWSTRIRSGDDRDFLKRAQQANAKLGFQREIGVLKFAAETWKNYSLTGDFPQAKYVEGMRLDAAKLANDLLLEIATIMSQQPVPIQGAVPLPGPLRAFLEWAMDRYGRDRWPVNDFLYSRWRARSGLARKK